MTSGKPISKELIQQMREEVLKGKSKFQVSKEMHLPSETVYKHTKDLPNKYHREPYISGKPFELLKQLLEKGFVYTERDRNALRSLQRFFPQIKRSQYKNRSCYYLEDKNKQALLELMKRNTSRIISYQDLANAAHVFNTDIEIHEKRSFLGRNLWRKTRKIKESAVRYRSNPKEKQSLLDDFLGRFLHTDVLENRVLCFASCWKIRVGYFDFIFFVVASCLSWCEPYSCNRLFSSSLENRLLHLALCFSLQALGDLHEIFNGCSWDMIVPNKAKFLMNVTRFV